MKILIVDDTPLNLKLLCAQLEAENHEVLTAKDGVDALDLLDLQSVDAVISDILMPRMDGYRLCFEMRRQERLKHLPFIIYSATYTSPGDEKLALDVGADKYLKKPASVETLVAALHEVVRLPPERHLILKEMIPDLDLLKEYSQQLVIKLEEKNADLQKQSDDLREEIAQRTRVGKALIESEDRYRDLVENSRDLICTHDLNGRLLSVNKAAEKILGFSMEELVGKNLRDITPPELARGVNAYLKVIKMRNEARGEWQVLTKSGESRILEYSNNVRSDGPDGSLVRGLARDVTERKKAEVALAERTRIADLAADVGRAITQNDAVDPMLEACVQAMVHHLDAAFARIWELNETDNVLELRASAGMYTHLDGPHGRVPVGKFKIGLIAQERKPHLTNSVVGDSRVSDQEWAIREKMVSFAGYPLIVEGRLVGVAAMFARRPLTELAIRGLGSISDQIAIGIRQKRAKQALRIRDAQFRSLMESNIVGIILSDLEGAVTGANAAYLKLVGATADELASGTLRWDVLIPPEFRETTQRMTREVLAHGSCTPTEVEVCRKDGSRVSTLVGVALLENSSKDCICILLDISDRKRAETRVIEQLNRIEGLRKIDSAISGSLDLRVVLIVVLEQVLSLLQVDAAVILLFNEQDQSLRCSESQGFRQPFPQNISIRLGDGYAGKSGLSRSMVRIPDLRHSSKGFAGAHNLRDEGFISYLAVPLVAKGQLNGVLEIFHRSKLDPDTDWLNFLGTLAGQAAIAIEDAQMFTNLQRSNSELFLAYERTLEGWVKALDIRDDETEGHTQRVTELTLRLARTMGLPEADILNIRRGALLHDIGKLGIPDSILLKPGKLTDEEWVIMRKHPVYAYDWLAPIEYLRSSLDIPYCHHEKWDGTGYPRGLKAEAIPYAARIFAIVDVWDALRSDRPYRKAWPKDKVMEHILSLSGTHFDPNVVQAFLKLDV